MSLADVVAMLPVIARQRRRGTPRKITAAVALSIAHDPASLSRLAKRHGLAKSTISRIKRGLLWANAIRELSDEEMSRVQVRRECEKDRSALQQALRMSACHQQGSCSE